MSRLKDSPTAFRAISKEEIDLLCCHCGETVNKLTGYEAYELARTLTGDLICRACWDQVSAGDVVPVRALRTPQSEFSGEQR